MGQQNTVMTPEVCKQAEELRRAGCSYAFIADRLGVSEGSVSWYCLKEGIDSPNTERKALPQTAPGPMVVKRGNHVVRHFSPDEDARLIAMEREGLNPTEIGRRLGRRPNTIRGRLMTLARQQERAEALSA